MDATLVPFAVWEFTSTTSSESKVVAARRYHPSDDRFQHFYQKILFTCNAYKEEDALAQYRESVR